MQLGSIVYNSTVAGSLGPSAANNGLSVSGGVVQLGGPSGAAGAAVLLNNREVPSNGFSFSFSGNGKYLIGSNAADGTDSQLQVFNNVSISNPNGTSAIRWNVSNGEPFFEFFGGAAQTQMAVVRSARAFTAMGVNAGGGSAGTTLANSPQSTTAFGFAALANIGFPAFNASAFGTNALRAMTSASIFGNDAFGLNSLLNLTTGISNAAFGYQALMNSVTDNQNSVLGNGIMTNTGPGNTGQGATGSNNTMIGYNAGILPGGVYLGVTTTFNGCIIVGSQSGVSTEGTALTNTTLIGNGLFTNVSNIVMLGLTTQNALIGFASNTADNGTRIQINGGISAAIRFTAVNTTATGTDYSIIATANMTLTLPAAASVVGRVYQLVAQGAAVTMSLSLSYVLFNGSTLTQVNPSTGVRIQATASGWAQIP